jgi:hypothetical protein
METGRDSQSTIPSPCRLQGPVTRPGLGVSICVGGIGLEPTTSAMSKQCSNQLSYPPRRRELYTGERKKARRFWKTEMVDLKNVSGERMHGNSAENKKPEQSRSPADLLAPTGICFNFPRVDRRRCSSYRQLIRQLNMGMLRRMKLSISILAPLPTRFTCHLSYQIHYILPS